MRVQQPQRSPPTAAIVALCSPKPCTLDVAVAANSAAQLVLLSRPPACCLTTPRPRTSTPNRCRYHVRVVHEPVVHQLPPTARPHAPHSSRPAACCNVALLAVLRPRPRPAPRQAPQACDSSARYAATSQSGPVRCAACKPTLRAHPGLLRLRTTQWSFTALDNLRLKRCDGLQPTRLPCLPRRRTSLTRRACATASHSPRRSPRTSQCQRNET